MISSSVNALSLFDSRNFWISLIIIGSSLRPLSRSFLLIGCSDEGIANQKICWLQGGGEQLSNNVTSLQRLRMVYDMRNNVFQRRSIETSKIFLRWYGQDPNTWFRQHQNVYLSMS